MYGRYPKRWEYDADDNTVYADRVAVDGLVVREMVILADSYLEGKDVIFYWDRDVRDCCVKRQVEIVGVKLEISIISDMANCQIRILGDLDEMNESTASIIWSGDLEYTATSFSHLLATAKAALIEHLQKEDDNGG